MKELSNGGQLFTKLAREFSRLPRLTFNLVHMYIIRCANAISRLSFKSACKSAFDYPFGRLELLKTGNCSKF